MIMVALVRSWQDLAKILASIPMHLGKRAKIRVTGVSVPLMPGYLSGHSGALSSCHTGIPRRSQVRLPRPVRVPTHQGPGGILLHWLTWSCTISEKGLLLACL